MNDLISVIVPCYKVEEYLAKCIESIQKQTYKNLEIILVDDGSPDSCDVICDEYAKKDERIKVTHKENGGLSDARNAGINIAKGSYIAFVDSDDLVTEDYIEYMYNMIVQTNCNLAISGVKTIFKNDEIKEEEGKRKNEVLTAEQTYEKLLFADVIDVCAYAKLYKKELFDDIRFPKGRVYEDTAIMYKIIEKADEKIVFGDKCCYYYISRAGSISKHTEFNEDEKDYIEFTNKMLNHILNKYPNLETAVHRFDIYARFRILRMLVFTTPRNKKMEKEYVKAIKKYQKEVFKDKRTHKRDKLAIITLNLGLPAFKIMWRAYCKFTGRI